MPDPKTHKDWEIAQAAEAAMRPIADIGRRAGLRDDELLHHGPYFARVDYARVLERLDGAARGKYIDVTAVTPTPLGEGKSTTTIGLVQGLGRLGKRVSAAMRQPSGGPTMNIKGSAAGGGLSQIMPRTEFSLGLTGDINAVGNAHNLAMVALNARMQHEFNYDDAALEALGLRRLNIDPTKVQIGWALDFCAQSLRHMVTGLGGKFDGMAMESRADITVASEVMAILAVARDLADLRQRMGRMVVAFDRGNRPVTTADLEVDGAMTAWMVQAINPTMMQTFEGQPVFIHAGPFANIAVGQSSVIADRLGLRLSEYHVTESGFAADIGFEKFWNLKCRASGLVPDAAVIVTTVRAMKAHGGAPRVIPGKALPAAYTESHPDWVEAGCANLLHHIGIVRRAGVSPVVCINAFYTDHPDEIAVVRRMAEQAGARVAVSRHWELGGDGARELGEAVIEAAEEPGNFTYLYDTAMPLRQRVELIAKDIYGADGVDFTPEAEKKAAAIEADPARSELGVCMAKTHLSLSDNPRLMGVPKGWRLTVRDILTYMGAGYVVPVAGDIKLMPGTGSDPAFRRIDVDTTTGNVTGL